MKYNIVAPERILLCYVQQISYNCHSRAGGSPGIRLLDSCLRRNDGWVYFILLERW
jgi:hypothetical protein